jgi:hypothetical protein
MSTSLPGDTPASRSQRQAKGKAKKTRGISGLTSSTPFAQYDPDSHSWKTCEGTSLWDSETFSPTLPVAGILRNGRLFQRPRLVPRTVATASSSWPTPTTMDHLPPRSEEALERQQTNNRPGRTTPPTLKDAVAYPNKWPTPQVDDSKNVNPSPKRRKTLVSEVQKVENWPTPMATGGGGSGHWQMIEKKYSEGKITHEEKMAFQAGLRGIGKLNPEWVGWLMGFPPGWTNLEDSETPSSLTSPNSSEG